MLNLIKLANKVNKVNKANNPGENTYKTNDNKNQYEFESPVNSPSKEVVKEIEINNNKTQVNQAINQTDGQKIINKIKTILDFIKNNEGEYEIKDKDRRKVLISINNDGLTIVIGIKWTEIEVDMNWTEIEDSTSRKIVESLEQQWLLADFIERLKYNKENENANIKKLLNL